MSFSKVLVVSLNYIEPKRVEVVQKAEEHSHEGENVITAVCLRWSSSSIRRDEDEAERPLAYRP